MAVVWVDRERRYLFASASCAVPGAPCSQVRWRKVGGRAELVALSVPQPQVEEVVAPRPTHFGNNVKGARRGGDRAGTDGAAAARRRADAAAGRLSCLPPPPPAQPALAGELAGPSRARHAPLPTSCRARGGGAAGAPRRPVGARHARRVPSLGRGHRGARHAAGGLSARPGDWLTCVPGLPRVGEPDTSWAPSSYTSEGRYMHWREWRQGDAWDHLGHSRPRGGFRLF